MFMNDYRQWENNKPPACQIMASATNTGPLSDNIHLLMHYNQITLALNEAVRAANARRPIDCFETGEGWSTHSTVMAGRLHAKRIRKISSRAKSRSL
jgi:hypothetical protein